MIIQQIMNKSVLTNFIASVILMAGFLTDDSILTSIGLFALSGALTNWLAVHMLFEKVPGLYGSGVIPARFQEFKQGIKTLMMEQFFTAENIERFLSDAQPEPSSLDLAPVVEQIDFSPAFDGLIEVIESSNFGSMLAMVGGTAVLEPLREPFIARMQGSMTELAQDEKVVAALGQAVESPDLTAQIQTKVEAIVEQRLSELTPQLVKEIVQDMIRKHLGWLVVWGGVFGGAIGLLAGVMGF